MEIINYILLALITMLIFTRFMPVKGIKQISTKDLRKILHDKDKQFIDVRTQSEFKGRAIPSFQNIPLQQLKDRAVKLDKDKEVVVICQSGMRSMKAAKQLKKLGHSKITNIKGGMSAW